MIKRCQWVDKNDETYCLYHDTEWGVPVKEDMALFEKLMLDGFQAGLSWITVLKKRKALQLAFDGFNPEKIIHYDQKKYEELLNNSAIIRSRTKIKAMISNAHAYIKMQEEGISFSKWIWEFVNGETRQNHWKTTDMVPTQTIESQALSTALRQRGFKFCGPVIVYAFMQAVGMVNDHTIDCFRYQDIIKYKTPTY